MIASKPPLVLPKTPESLNDPVLGEELSLSELLDNNSNNGSQSIDSETREPEPGSLTLLFLPGDSDNQLSDIPDDFELTALCGTTGVVCFFLFRQVFTRTAALISILNCLPSKWVHSIHIENPQQMEYRYF
jgi:hypothetical protein